MASEMEGDHDSAPEDSVAIWRYMSVARFLTLVADSSIYFARVHELRSLGDPWEGVWTERCSRQILAISNSEFNQMRIRDYNNRALISVIDHLKT
jgi:hypothetical protein